MKTEESRTTETDTGDKTNFIEKMRDIKKQLESLFENNPEQKECCVVFMASQDKNDGYISSVGFTIGTNGNIVNNIANSCEDPRLLNLFRHGISIAMIHEFSKGGK